MSQKIIVKLLILALGIFMTIGCNDQQPAQQAPAAPAASNQAPVKPIQVPGQVQETEAANQPRLTWVLPAKWAMGGKDEQSFSTSQDMLATNWVLMLDNSGSMKTTQCSGKDSRMVAGGKAVVNFSRQRPDKDNFGLVLFTGRSPYAQVAMSLGEDRTAFAREVQKASPDFNTPLGPAIELAYAELFRQGKRQGWYGMYHIVVVTDGDWNQGDDPGPIVKRIVTGSPVQIHTVGFCTGAGHRLNMSGYTSYVSADNAAEVNTALQDVITNAESEIFMDPQFK